MYSVARPMRMHQILHDCPVLNTFVAVYTISGTHELLQAVHDHVFLMVFKLCMDSYLQHHDIVLLQVMAPGPHMHVRGCMNFNFRQGGHNQHGVVLTETENEKS